MGLIFHKDGERIIISFEFHHFVEYFVGCEVLIEPFEASLYSVMIETTQYHQYGSILVPKSQRRGKPRTSCFQFIFAFACAIMLVCYILRSSFQNQVLRKNWDFEIQMCLEMNCNTEVSNCMVDTECRNVGSCLFDKCSWDPGMSCASCFDTAKNSTSVLEFKSCAIQCLN